VNVEAGTVERWGDYSGISRRHSANGPEVWISGCFGNNEDNGSNVLSTWIAQITDQQADVAPTANFTANQTEIMTGQSVEFTDHSTNIPTSWSWTFPGGTPSTSNQQNPTVTYEQEGTYDVTLSVQNGFGSDDEIKTGFIKVTGQLQIPVADFTSDITSVNTGEVVHFQDLSENGPTTWQWFFPGGTPSLSGEQNPVVTYTEPGCHNVTLDAINNAGTDVITKTCYIDVLSTAVTEPDIYFNKFVVYPNPVSDGRLNVEFEIEHRMELDFLVIDEQGRLIKNLLHRIVKGGLNDLAFNTDPLAPGAYYLIVNNEKADVLKTVKFIVLQ
jgi:PKD repeat protein